MAFRRGGAGGYEPQRRRLSLKKSAPLGAAQSDHNEPRDVQTATEDVRFGASRPTRSTWQQDWFCNVRRDLLAGLVVALALIPEAIAFDKPGALDLAPTH